MYTIDAGLVQSQETSNELLHFHYMSFECSRIFFSFISINMKSDFENWIELKNNCFNNSLNLDLLLS